MITVVGLVETFAFAILCAMMRTYVSNEHLILLLLCVFLYVMIFRDEHSRNPNKIIF
jgi:Ca2+/Na+ antiporter